MPIVGQEKQNDSNLQFKEDRESLNYLKLKRKFKALREVNNQKQKVHYFQQEYLKVLENWEDTNKKVKALSKEKKFLRDKLDCFLKSQHFNISDEALTAAVLAKMNDTQPNQGQTQAPIAKQSSMHQSEASSNYNPTQQQSQQQIHQQQQNQQKRRKKDSMHYPMSTHHSSNQAQPIFGTQDVSKGHQSSGIHHMNTAQGQQPQQQSQIPNQNIFQATNGNQGAPMINKMQNQQIPNNYVDHQSQQRIFNTNLVTNGNRDQREHHSSKQSHQIQQQANPQMMQGQDFQIMNAQTVKPISAQQSHL